MKAKIHTMIVLAAFAVFAAACGGPAGNENVADNANTGNASPTTFPTSTPVEKVNDGPTLTPVFKAYCEANAKKDFAALRKIWAAETLKGFEEDAKDAGKTVDEIMYDENITGEVCDVINEKIDGDRAVAVIRSGTFPNGIDILFLKENGEWKLTTRSPSIESKIKE